jgi:regulation of enolase protein 1 (concanavalin A-like superfamily)
MIHTSISNLLAQDKPLGLFDNHTDIGKVEIPGTAIYNPYIQEYTIEGSGKNIWFDSDQFHYLWKKVSGDFILTAKIEFVGKGVEPHRKIGWMVRQSLDTSSAHISTVIHGDGLTSFQYRRAKGNNMEEIRSDITAPGIVQLERKGNTFIMSVARFGETFTTSEISYISLDDEVYVGLFVCAHNPKVTEKAIFRNVQIVFPAKAGFIPYTDYIGSNLELMDIESGIRKIIYQSPYSIQAPNWTPDGKTLIYNSKGLLYRFDLASNKSTELNTDFANNNNNDHVLSFNGKMIGISHHSVDDNHNSIVYTLPVEGGKPVRVTPQGPSYLHGWSPDGKYLIYTGGRNNSYNIYKISVDGGEETQLTSAKGLDDGSEYTPDGRYIYFNSNRTGKMQIWRMQSEGSNQEQVTNDEYNNWFPHISPDGKWIVILTFPKDIDSGDHPFYKHVYIRLMPASGGHPKVIAYLYGGQGTINVPSWSPDSKKIAFISNTDFQ